MKKAFDQTFREIKREVNKKVLKVPGIEQKILDATSNEPWGPHGTHLADLAQASRNYHDHQIIMTVIWKRINDTGKNWRHVYKALMVLEYLVAHGSERVIDEIKEHSYQISTLGSFQYIDSGGRDQGSNVRRKSQNLVALVNDRDRVKEIRQKASANKDDRRASAGGNLYYRDDDQYNMDSEERYGVETYRDEDEGGDRRSDDYQFGSRNRRSIDRDTERSFDDDNEHRSSRAVAGRGEGLPHEERQTQGRLSGQSANAPPSYEEAVTESRYHAQNERNGEAPNEYSSHAPQLASTSDSMIQGTEQGMIGELAHGALKPASPSEYAAQGKECVMTSGHPETTNNEDNFDEFDPRNSFQVEHHTSSSEMDLLGLSASGLDLLAATPMTSAATTSLSNPIDSGLETSSFAPSAGPTFSIQSFDDPFGDGPFKATPLEDSTVQQPNIPSASFPYSSYADGNASTQQEGMKVNEFQTFDLGDMLGGPTYTPTIPNGQQPSGNSLPPELNLPHTAPGGQSMQQPNLQTAHVNFLQTTEEITSLPQEFSRVYQIDQESDPLDGILPRTVPQGLVSSHATQPAVYQNIQTANLDIVPQSGFPADTPQTAAVSYQQTQSGTSPMTQTNIEEDNDPLYGLFPPTCLASSHTAEPAPSHTTVYQNAETANSNVLPHPGFSNFGSYQANQSQFATSPYMQPMASASYQANQSQTALPNFMQPMPSASDQANPLAPSTFMQPNILTAPSSMLQQKGTLTQPPQAGPTSIQASQPYAPQEAPTKNTNLAPLRHMPQTGLSGPVVSQAASITAVVPQTNSQQSMKFEPKSAIWADTLSRGLVDLNISGPKTNPLADIGVDFEAMNRKEKRNEPKSNTTQVTSTVTMGRAMGAGSGLGRAGTSGFNPPNPMMGPGMGMGIGIPGYGGNMNMNPQMGIGMGVSMGMGMNTNIRLPTGMPPPPSGTMPGNMGYNPNTGGFGSKQNYGG